MGNKKSKKQVLVLNLILIKTAHGISLLGKVELEENKRGIMCGEWLLLDVLVFLWIYGFDTEIQAFRTKPGTCVSFVYDSLIFLITLCISIHLI